MMGTMNPTGDDRVLSRLTGLLPDHLVRLWNATNRAIIMNAGSMIGTTVATSVLGAGYWLLAARFFTQETVGLAGAAIAAMNMLGIGGTLGLGTLLIGELPRRKGEAGSLISSALAASAAAAAAVALLLAIVVRFFSDHLSPLGATPASAALFALGAGLTALTLVLDQALVGLLRGGVQLWRNIAFATAKLGALFLVGVWLRPDSWVTIYATWIFGNILSLALVAGFALRFGGRWHTPSWELLRRFRGAAVRHHSLNLALWVPGFAMPIVATAVLSPTVNAYFYIASMVAGFVFAPPLALTTALYAIGAGSSTALAQRARLTLGLALAAGIAANVALLPTASIILRVFGSEYAEQAATMLRLIALIVFPIIIKDHYVAIHRINGDLSRAAILIALGSFGELAGATAGAFFGGLPGLVLGWLAASCLQAAAMSPMVYQTLRGRGNLGTASRADPLVIGAVRTEEAHR